MHHLFIMVGISGSGKSTWIAETHPAARVHSADKLFINEAGEYVFQPERLGEAHAACIRGVVSDLTSGPFGPFGRPPPDRTIVVDNTNTTLVEIAPYVALAQAYGARVTFVRVECSPEVAAARNKHGVSLAAIQGMKRRIDEIRFPQFWDVGVLVVNGESPYRAGL